MTQDEYEERKRALGFTPERSSLHRVLEELIQHGILRLHSRGSGRTPNVYRKTAGTA